MKNKMVRRRCDFLFVEGDPVRVMDLTQQMVEQFEKANGVRGKEELQEEGGEVVVEASVRSAGSGTKRRRHLRVAAMMMTIKVTSGEMSRTSLALEETVLKRVLSSLRMARAAVMAFKGISIC